MAVAGRVPRTPLTKTLQSSHIRRAPSCHAAIAAAMFALVVVNIIKGAALPYCSPTTAGTTREEKKVPPGTTIVVPAAAETKVMMLSDFDNSSSNSHDDDVSVRARQLHSTDAAVTEERCSPSSLWKRVVDPASLEFGCVEIKVKNDAENCPLHVTNLKL